MAPETTLKEKFSVSRKNSGDTTDLLKPRAEKTPPCEIYSDDEFSEESPKKLPSVTGLKNLRIEISNTQHTLDTDTPEIAPREKENSDESPKKVNSAEENTKLPEFLKILDEKIIEKEKLKDPLLSDEALSDNDKAPLWKHAFNDSDSQEKGKG